MIGEMIADLSHRRTNPCPAPEAIAGRSHRSRLRPSIEGLETRKLLTQSGFLDPSFGNGKGYVLTQPVADATADLTDYTSTVVEPDGSILVDGPVGTADSTFGVIHIAADGTADTAFGATGEADVALPPGLAPTGPPTELLLQADGKILVVGTAQTTGFNPQTSTIVARFNANGSPDTTFGTGGVVTLNQATVGAAGVSLPYAALQSDGKILLVGSSTVSGTITQVASVRLTTTGAFDASYGTGGLLTIDDIPSGSPMPTESALGVAFQPDGKIVILANLTSSAYVTYAGSMSLQTSVTAELIRLDSDGTRDASLSQAGLLASDVYTPLPNGLIIQPDGKFLLLGRSSSLQFVIPILARLNADGSFEKQMAVSFANDFALEPDGKVVLSGTAYYDVSTNPLVIGSRDFVAFRTTASLDLDPSFGQGGMSVILSIPSSPEPGGDRTNPVEARALAIGPNSQIVELGSSYDSPKPALVVARLSVQATHGDFTGDGVSDPAIYLTSYAAFAIGDSSGKTPGETVPFGIPGPGQTIPAPGNYYDTGQDDIAAYLPALGVYAIQDPTGKTSGREFSFGIPGLGQTIPVPGDYFGTGQDDIAGYLTEAGVFAIEDPTGRTTGRVVQFGMAGPDLSIPVPGDYYGTGQDDLAVYMPTIGAFAIQDPTGQTTGKIIPFGKPGIGNSIPIPGDYDGSGKTELAVYIPSLAELIYRPANGGPDVTIPFGLSGTAQTLPAPGDYDGSGKTEAAGYLPALGSFVYKPASGGNNVYDSFGVAGPDQSIPVSTVVLSPVPGTVTTEAIRTPSLLGEPDPLDFVFIPSTSTKKPKSGDSTA